MFILFYQVKNIVYINSSNNIINNYTNNDITTSLKTISSEYTNILHNYKYYSEINGYSKILWLHKTDIPDVYYYTHEKFSNKEGIVLIPNIKISHLCDNLIKHELPQKSLCHYSNKFDKWIPIYSMK